MTTSRQKAIGSQAERDVAMRMHGERIGGYGPADVRAPLVGYHQLQVKRLSAAPSLNAIRAMLARIPYKSTQLRGVVVYRRVEGRIQRTITFDLDEYEQWYGAVPEA